ncbi:MAG: Ig-like domain-containing protein, partial [Chloroflexota bacterium]|nr:Ig-like domain-containing protein [Chloroflexota bacterium]
MNVSAPQTRLATATAPETTAPILVSAAGSPGATSVTLTFDEPVYCIGLSFNSLDITITDNNPATTDPIAVGAGPNGCGVNQATADTSFSVQFSAPLLGGTDYTIFVTAEANEIQDVFGNDLANPSSANFSTGPADIGNPTITDTQLISNLATTDFGEVGDSFESTFSEPMNGSTSGAINLQDADGTGAFLLICGVNSTCTWNTAVTTLTVTLVTNWVGTGGTTPGLQVPVTITTMGGFTDTAGNVVNLAGSADRIIDNELLTGPFAPPTLTDARVLGSFGTSDFDGPGDSFTATFSHAMLNTASRILLQDQDGSLTNLECGTHATCTWDVASTKLTVTLIVSVAPFGGSTPGLQIPIRIAM